MLISGLEHRKTLDRTTRKIVGVTNRTLASAYVLCHLTLLLSLFQKYKMEISSSIEEEIQEMAAREDWGKTKLIFKTKVHDTKKRIDYIPR